MTSAGLWTVPDDDVLTHASVQRSQEKTLSFQAGSSAVLTCFVRSTKQTYGSVRIYTVLYASAFSYYQSLTRTHTRTNRRIRLIIRGTRDAKHSLRNSRHVGPFKVKELLFLLSREVDYLGWFQIVRNFLLTARSWNWIIEGIFLDYPS
jgi:hypothetical protein